MPLASSPDHVAIVVPDYREIGVRWEEQLGGVHQWRFHTPTVFRGTVFQYSNGGLLEVLMPSDAEERSREMGGPSGFVEAFLDRFGAAVHHVTIKVPDIHEALATLEDDGFTPRDVNTDDPAWQEAFLRPSEVGGLIVQVAAATQTAEEFADSNGFTPAGPPDAGPALLGPQLVHPDLEDARRVWTALGGKIEEADDGLLVAWPGHALTVAIAHAPDEQRPRTVGLRFTDTAGMPADPVLGPAVLPA